MEQIQMIYGSCIRAISGDVDMDIKELMRQKEDIMQLDEKMRKNHIARVGKESAIPNLLFRLMMCSIILTGSGTVV